MYACDTWAEFDGLLFPCAQHGTNHYRIIMTIHLKIMLNHCIRKTFLD